jgi:DNA-binding response OmpR family regulator
MPNTRKILIIDDDPELRGALTEQLSLYEEYEAVPAENGNKGVQAAKAGQIDLVIMDVGLPDIHGREAVRILRRNGFKAPIIMLTGHDTDSDTILGLESGANDYVTTHLASPAIVSLGAYPHRRVRIRGGSPKAASAPKSHRRSVD